MSDGDRSDPPRHARRSEGSQAAIDLLDLVRAAEDEAVLAAKRRASSPDLTTNLPTDDAPTSAVTTASTDPPHSDVRAREDVVDVGDDAIDAPPSLPPARAASERPSTGVHPTMKNLREREDRRQKREDALAAAEDAMTPARRLPPGLSILLVLALAAFALAFIAR